MGTLFWDFTTYSQFSQSVSVMAFQFSHVIVCEIPDSYAKAALGLSGEVDMVKSRAQHKAYVDAIKSLGVEVITLPADEKFPDCVFVEDTAVIVHGHALLTRPGDPSRFDEIKNMKPVLEKQGLVVMTITDENAKLDGGDVIFTGKEILVGLSKRTNEAGVQAIAEAFPGFPTTAIPVSGPLHLKTLVTMCSPDTLCASSQTGDSTEMLKRIEQLATFKYGSLIVPDDMASNTICMNGTLFHKSAKESKEPADIFADFVKTNKGVQEGVERTLQYFKNTCTSKNDKEIASYFKGENARKEVDESIPDVLKNVLLSPTATIGLEMSELEKAVGSLTCMSLRFNPLTRVGLDTTCYC